MPRRRPPTLAALLLLAAACGGAQPARTEARMRETPWTVTYADGAANVYRFSQPSPGAAVAFAYDPVTPERSSTGHYSGGDPVTASLAATDPRLDELWRRVAALEGDGALHTPDRAKGTGAFGVLTPAGERSFIVQAGPALADFHAFVATFRR